MWTSFKDYPSQVYRANAMFCLTEIPFYSGNCKGEAVLALLRHQQKLIEARDKDGLNGEVEVYLKLIMKNIRPTPNFLSSKEKS